jgi:hypothetical protein
MREMISFTTSQHYKEKLYHTASFFFLGYEHFERWLTQLIIIIIIIIIIYCNWAFTPWQ